jgi:hypothetical protein
VSNTNHGLPDLGKVSLTVMRRLRKGQTVGFDRPDVRTDRYISSNVRKLKDQRGKEFITKTAILVDPKTADSKRVIYVTRVQ